MKKFVISCFYFILTLSVSAFGFRMPLIVADYMDERTAEKTEHPSIEPVEFVYSSSLLDTLKLISEDCYYVTYPTDMGAHTEQEIYDIARDIQKRLKACGITIFSPDDPIVSNTLQMQLAIATKPGSTDNSSSAEAKTDSLPSDRDAEAYGIAAEDSKTAPSDITTAAIWICSITAQSGEWATFNIDDKSGKLIGLMITRSSIAYSYNDGIISLNALAEAMTAFLQAHYDGLQVRLNGSDAKTNYDAEAAEVAEVVYTLDLQKDAGGGSVQLKLWSAEQIIALN